jgi:hypothetical protein
MTLAQPHPAHNGGRSMDKNAELTLKSNPLSWAQSEYETDFEYWQDRVKNGTGLIQQIANFVLKQAAQGVEK